MSSFARWEERSARAGTVWMSEWMRRSLSRGTYWAVALRMTIPFDLTCYYRVTRHTLHVAKHEEEQHPVSKQSRYPCNSALGSSDGTNILLHTMWPSQNIWRDQ